MFGFPLLLGHKFDSLFGSNKVFDEWFGFDKDAEIKEANLIDVHRFPVGKLVYEQKVYRLKDNTIFVDTAVLRDEEIETLEQRLKLAIIDQNFEEAAKLRDEIKSKK